MTNHARLSNTPACPNRLWLALVLPLAAILTLTVYTDRLFSAEKPNPLFYAAVPIVSVMSTAAIAVGAGRLLTHRLALLQALAIVAGISIIMQCSEIILKAIWHLIWHNQGVLYMMFDVLLSLALTTCSFIRYTGMKWGKALTVAVTALFGDLIVTGTFVALTGPSTPGS